MKPALNDDDLSEMASEVLAAAAAAENDMESNKRSHKIEKLNDVRDRLKELKGIVSSYEVCSSCAHIISYNHGQDRAYQMKQNYIEFSHVFF